MANNVIDLDPEELVFRDVQFGQVYTQALTLSSTVKSSVDVSIKPGSSDRYTVTPATLRLKPNESATVQVKLRVLRFAQRQKAVEQGQRDVFHIKGTFFDQKLYGTFFLAPDAVEPSGKAVAAQGTKPKTSPRDHPAPRSAPTSPPRGSDQGPSSLQQLPRAASGPLSAAATLRHSTSTLLPGPSGRSGSMGQERPTHPVRTELAETLKRMASPTREPRRLSLDAAGSEGAHSGVSGESSPTLAPSSPSWSGAGHTTTTVRALASARSGQRASFDFGQSAQRAGRTPLGAPMLGRAAVAAAASAVSSSIARTQQGGGPALGRPPLAPAQRLAAAVHARSASASPLRGEGGAARTPAPRLTSVAEVMAGVGAPAAASRSTSPPGHSRYEAPSASQPVLRRTASADGSGGDGSYPSIPMPRNVWLDPPLAARDSGTSSRQILPGLDADEDDHVEIGADAVDEVRAVGLHRVRSSVQRLELASAELRSRSQSPASPHSRAGSPSPRSASPAAMEGHRKGLEMVREAEARSRSVSRSPSPSPPHSPSQALQNVLQQMRPVSPGKLGIASWGGGEGASFAGFRALERAMSGSLGTSSHLPTMASIGGRVGVQHGVQAAAANVRTHSPSPTPETRSPGASPSRAAQIGASTAALRAAFSGTSGGAAVRASAPVAASHTASRLTADTATRNAAIASASRDPTTAAEPAPRPSMLIKPTPASRVPDPAPRHTATSSAVAAAAAGTNVQTSSISAPLPTQPGELMGGARPSAVIAPLSAAPTAPQPARPPLAGSTEAAAAFEALRAQGEASRAEAHSRLQAAADREALLSATIRDQLSALVDKEDIIKSLQSQLEIARKSLALAQPSAVRGAAAAALEAAGSPEGAAAALAAQVEELSAVNEQLHAQVRELEAQVTRFRDEAASLRRMSLELQARAPDAKRLLDAAIAREQVLQEERNRKALEVLLSKDAQLEKLQDKVASLQEEAEQLRASTREALDCVAEREGAVVQGLRARDTLRAEMEAERARWAQKLVDLHADLEALRSAGPAHAAAERAAAEASTALGEARARLGGQAGELAACRGEAARLLEQLSRADARIQFLEDVKQRAESQHEERIRAMSDAHRARVIELEARVEAQREMLEGQKQQLQTIYNAGAGGRLPRLGMPATGRASTALEASSQQRLLAAEALNAQLEEELQDTRAALLVAQRQQAADESMHLGGPGSGRPASDTHKDQAGAALLAARASGLAGESSSGGSDVMGRFEMERLRELVAERDRELAELRAELSLVSASRDEPGEEARTLAAQLAASEMALRVAHERMASLEAAAAVAQESSQQGAAAQRELGNAAADVRRAQADAEVARATAARMNARISELAASEADARAAAQAAQLALERADAMHARDMAALEARVSELLALLDAQQQRQLASPGRAGGRGGGGSPGRSPGKQPMSSAQVPGSQDHATAVAQVRVEQLEQAVEASESALAQVQARLLDALKGRCYAQAEIVRLRRDAERERARMESEVRTAREEGTIRVRGLEDALARLGAAARAGGAGEMSVEATRLAAEADTARRAEARALGQVEHLKEMLAADARRVSALEEEITAREHQLAQLWVYTAYGPAAAPEYAPPLLPLVGQNLGPARSSVPAKAGPSQPANPAATQAAQRAIAPAVPLPSGRQSLSPGRQRGAGGREVAVRADTKIEGTAEAGDEGAPVLLDPMLERRLRRQYEELVSRQQIIARLSDECEAARTEADSARAELAKLRAALPDPNLPEGAQQAELRLKLAACEGELRAAVQARELAEIEAAHKAVAATEAEREAAAARKALAAQESALAAAQDDAARRAAQVHGALSSEVAALSRAHADAEQSAAALEVELADARHQLTLAQAEAARLSNAVQAASSAAQRATADCTAERNRLQQQLSAAKKDAMRAAQDAEQRRAQVAVLMETIETLQAGGLGEAEQRVVALSAQLAAAKAREINLDARCSELLEDAEAAAYAASAAAADARAAQAGASDKEVALAAATAAARAVETALAGARADARARTNDALKAAREADELRARLGVVEADAEGLRTTLRDMSARHLDTLNSEREEAAEALRHVRNESAMAASRQAATTPSHAFVSRLEAPLQDLAAAVLRRAQPQPAASAPGAAASSPSDASWTTAVIGQLKVITLDAVRMYHAAAVDARLAQEAARAAQSRVATQSAQLEARTAAWQVAEVARQRLERVNIRRAVVGSAQSVELVKELQQRLADATQQLDSATAQAVQATAEAAAASSALNAERARADTLARQLEVCTAEGKELAARLTAAQMEAWAGCPQSLPAPNRDVSTGPMGAAARLHDSTARFIEDQVGRLSLRGDARDKVLSMLQELAGLRSSEAALQASLAAAQRRGDSATMLASSLKEAVRKAEARIDQLQRSASAAAGVAATSTTAQAASSAADGLAGEERTPAQEGASTSTSCGPWSAAHAAAHDVARVRAQLVVSMREVAALRDQVLEAQQAAAQRQLDVQELQAQGAAHELILQQLRDEGATALMMQRTSLDAAHDADRALLLREVSELSQRLDSMRALAARDAADANARLDAVRNAVGGEMESVLARSLEGYVEQSALHAAEACAAHAEREVSRLNQEMDALQAELTRAHAQVAELTDIKDVTAAAMSDLEDTLTRIEAQGAAGLLAPGGAAAGATAARRSKVGRPESAGPSNGRVSGSGGGSGGSSTVEGLSREIVRAKLAEADAVRRLRAAARTEVELRQRVMQRDARVSELKDALAALQKGGVAAAAGAARGRPPFVVPGNMCGQRSRSPSPPAVRTSRIGATSPMRTSLRALPTAEPTGAGSKRRAVSVQRVRGDVVRSSQQGPLDGSKADGGSKSLVEMEVQLAAWEREYERLSSALSTARGEAARRDAEIARLEVELAQAVARQQQPGSPAPTAGMEQLRAQLAATQAELTGALTSANAMLRKLGAQSVDDGSVQASLASPRKGYAAPRDLPHKMHLPAALAAAMARLSDCVSAQLSQPRPALPPISGLHSGGSGAGAMAALRLDAAERRARELQEAVERLTSEKDDTARQLHLARTQAAFSAAAAMRSPAAGTTAETSGAAQNQDQTHSQTGALVELLQHSVLALHGACKQVEDAAAPARPSIEAVKQGAGKVVSELLSLEATIGLLVHELRRTPPTQAAGHTQATENQAQGGRPAAGGSAEVRAAAIAAQAFADAGVDSDDEACEGAGDSQGSVFSFGQHGQQQRQANSKAAILAAAAAAGAATPMLARVNAGQGAAQEHTPTSSFNTTSSSEPSLGDVLRQAPHSLLTSAGDARYATVRPIDAAGLDPGTNTTNALLAERLLEARARADKWKARARQLGQQLALMGAGAAARDAATLSRTAANERGMQEQVLRLKADVARLQAALAGADAARAELERAAATRPAAARDPLKPRDTNSSAPAAAGLVQDTCGAGGGQVGSMAARLAELGARCSTLERQLDTERAQAAAATGSLQEELGRMRSALVAEQGERARLLGGMRDALAGLRAGGDMEGKLRGELLQAHQESAAARSAQERAEAALAAANSDLRQVQDRLDASERMRDELVSRLDARLIAAERRCERIAQVSTARVDELAGRVAGAAASAAAAAPLAAEAQLQQLEEDATSLAVRVEQVERAARADRAADKWRVMALVARYQRAVADAVHEAEGAKEEARVQCARLQVSLSDATRRTEAAAAELRAHQERAAHAAREADRERQAMAERHLTHITSLQRRIDDERRALAQEAAARSEVLASAREGVAAATSAAQMAALEARYVSQLAASESCTDAMREEVAELQSAFQAYQAQKAAEISELEERLVMFIGGAVPAAQPAAGVTAHRTGGAVHVGGSRPHHASMTRAAARGAGKIRAGSAPAWSKAAAKGKRSAGLWADDDQEDGHQYQPAAAAGPMGTAATAVADAAAEDAAAAARREALFERLGRQRAEALLVSARKALQQAKTQLRMVARQLESVQKGSISTDEHARVLSELALCRETLKTARQESARRQRALQLLQGLANTGLLQPPTAPAAPVAPEPLLAQAAAAAAAAATAAAQAASSVASPINMPWPPPANDEDGAAGLFGGGAGQSGPSDDPFAAAATTAAAAAAAAVNALEQERAARDAVEAKLREAKAAAERKGTLAKELKRRVAELEGQVVSAEQLTAAEARAKAAQATAARKDALLREAREQIDALTRAAASGVTGSAAAAAIASGTTCEVTSGVTSGTGSALPGGVAAGGEVERLDRMAARLRAELARKENALRAAVADLEKERAAAAASARAAEEAAKREAKAWRHGAGETAALRSRASELLSALRELLRLLARATAAAAAVSPPPGTASNASVRASGRWAQSQPAGANPTRHPASTTPVDSGPSRPAAPPPAAAAAVQAATTSSPMSASDIASLTHLSVEEVTALLGGTGSRRHGGGGEGEQGREWGGLVGAPERPGAAWGSGTSTPALPLPQNAGAGAGSDAAGSGGTAAPTSSAGGAPLTGAAHHSQPPASAAAQAGAGRVEAGQPLAATADATGPGGTKAEALLELLEATLLPPRPPPPLTSSREAGAGAGGHADDVPASAQPTSTTVSRSAAQQQPGLAGTSGSGSRVAGRLVGQVGARLRPGGQARLGVTPGMGAEELRQQLVAQASAEGLLAWDPANLQLLLQHAEAEVAAAERSVAGRGLLGSRGGWSGPAS